MDDGGPQILFADDGDAGGGELPGLGASGGGPPAQLQELPPPPGFSAPASAGTAAPTMPAGQPAAAPSHGSAPSMPVKLFFGQVPRMWSDLEVRDIFDKYGSISDFIVLKFKDTGNSKGGFAMHDGPGVCLAPQEREALAPSRCGFVTFDDPAAAQRAQDELHLKVTLPTMTSPVEVKPPHSAADKANRGGLSAPPSMGGDDASRRPKLFVGQISPSMDDDGLTAMFSKYGEVESSVVMRHADSGNSKNCGFVNFRSVDACERAIQELHGKLHMPGCRDPLVVQFAETPRDKLRRHAGPRGGPPGGGGRHGGGYAGAMGGMGAMMGGMGAMGMG
ncbi:celf1, partial [Symbiodinium sp. KB8]